MTSDTILTTADDGVHTITLNRPDHRNAMTNAMAREVHRALERIAADPSARIVVLTGAGDRWFCPGADIAAVTAAHDAGAPLDHTPEVRRAYRVPTLLHAMPQITIAAVNGSAAGAGLGWALACDLRWSSDTARYATAFLERGVAGDMCLHWTLPRIVGPGRARQLMLFPRKLSAPEALALGLVEEILPATTFRGDIAARLDQLRAAPPLALRTMKENLVAAERTTIEDFSDLETARHPRSARLRRRPRGVRRRRREPPASVPGAMMRACPSATAERASERAA